jgi:UDP:flavonoid glycosyltransferase YjiC (YdhE family)
VADQEAPGTPLNNDAEARQRQAEQRAARLQRQLDELSAELAQRTGQVRYQLGDALVRACRPSWDTVLLPWRLACLLARGVRQVWNRRRTRSAPADAGPSPAAPATALRAAPADAARAAERGGLLFFCVNGAGLGHLTRALAIARRVRRRDPALPIYFLTSSQALGIIAKEGFVTYHIPPRAAYDAGMSTARWNRLLHEQLVLIGDVHRPDLLVYDGVSPYAGLLSALPVLGCRHNVLILRLRHRHARTAAQVDTLRAFDQVVLPGEPGLSVPPELAGLNCRGFDPIVYLDETELLSRDAARAVWGVPAERKLVYVQLGAGNINDTVPWQERVLAELSFRSEIDVVLADSPITQRQTRSRTRVHVLRDFPNSLYFNGFDLAVTAAGYNTFHELMHFGVPAVLAPNQETVTDDQVQRARVAQQAEAGAVVLALDDIGPALTAGLDPGVAGTWRANARRLVPRNGAADVAEHLLALAERPARVTEPPLEQANR